VPIYNDPELDQKLNKNKGKSNSISATKFCKFCGKQLVYSTTDKRNARQDPIMDERWEKEICYDCFHEGKHRNNGKSDNRSSRPFLGNE
jgi:hypothetical protein